MQMKSSADASARSREGEMRKYRVVRVNGDGELDVLELDFWTKNGAQRAANDMNRQFGGVSDLMNTLLGHNYWVTTVDRVPVLKTALAREKERQARTGK
jgi:hypothetical protein